MRLPSPTHICGGQTARRRRISTRLRRVVVDKPLQTHCALVVGAVAPGGACAGADGANARAPQDPDCAQVVDGSCYLEMTVSVTGGGLLLPGVNSEPVPALSRLEGHPPGLNVALGRMRYAPPASWPSGEVVELKVHVDRIVRPTVATPKGLLPQSVEGTVPIYVAPQDLRRGSIRGVGGSGAAQSRDVVKSSAEQP